MSYVQQILLRDSIRGGLSPKCTNRLEEITQLSFFPRFPDEDEVSIVHAELELVYLEFHKQFELDKIIVNKCMEAWKNEFVISDFELQEIIGEWRNEIDKEKAMGSDGDYLTEMIRIERKLSDLFQIGELRHHYWEIVYWHEGN